VVCFIFRNFGCFLAVLILDIVKNHGFLHLRRLQRITQEKPGAKPPVSVRPVAHGQLCRLPKGFSWP